MRAINCAFLIVPLFGLAGCSSISDAISSVNPTPTPTPGPSQASITVSRYARGTVGFSPLAAFNWRMTVPLRFTESAGLGANINYARLSFLMWGVEIERTEIGANDIIAGLGSNRLPASSSVQGNFIFNFNSSEWGTAVLTVGFTDDRGNNLEARLDLPITDFDWGPARSRQAD